MLFKIPELLVAITDVMDLHPGDIVLSMSSPAHFLCPPAGGGCWLGVAGTPKGVGRVLAGDELKASAFVGEQEITSFIVRAEDRTDKDGNPY